MSGIATLHPVGVCWDEPRYFCYHRAMLSDHPELVEYLPPKALELAEVIGLDALFRLVEQMGGLTCKVPIRPAPDHPLAVALGAEAFDALRRVYQGEQLVIPVLKTARQSLIWQAMRRDAKTLTRGQIARRYGYTERGVYKVLARERPDIDQGELF